MYLILLTQAVKYIYLILLTQAVTLKIRWCCVHTRARTHAHAHTQNTHTHIFKYIILDRHFTLVCCLVYVSCNARRMPQHKCFDLVRYFFRVPPCLPTPKIFWTWGEIDLPSRETHVGQTPNLVGVGRGTVRTGRCFLAGKNLDRCPPSTERGCSVIGLFWSLRPADITWRTTTRSLDVCRHQRESRRVMGSIWE